MCAITVAFFFGEPLAKRLHGGGEEQRMKTSDPTIKFLSDMKVTGSGTIGIIVRDESIQRKLQVYITKPVGASPIKYSDVSLRVTDKNGEEALPTRHASVEETYVEVVGAGSSTAVGTYIINLTEAQLPVVVEVSRNSDRQAFAVTSLNLEK